MMLATYGIDLINDNAYMSAKFHKNESMLNKINQRKKDI